MKTGLLIIKSKGEPDKVLFSDADTAKAKYRATDKEAILYSCVRIKEKRAVSVPSPEPTEPKPTQKKGKV